MSGSDRPATPAPMVALIPMKLDAFIFNEKVCSGGEKDAKIAPITQPNYTFLRLDQFFIQPDILDHADLHYSSPAKHNSRFTDLGRRETRRDRLGVYLHWMIPRPYRYGSTVKRKEKPVETDKGQTKDGSARPPEQPSGVPEEQTVELDPEAPKFQQVPNRWLVIRSIADLGDAGAKIGFPKVKAWVVESDRKQKLDALGEKVDLQVDVSPFIDAGDRENVSINKQAEVFIGSKNDAVKWTETMKDEESVSLSLLTSSNQLFADYQPHNSNVFSIVDNFEHNGNYLEQTKANYYVIGWHSKPESDLLYQNEPVSDRSARSEILSKLQMEIPGVEVTGISKWLNSKDSGTVLCHGAMYDVEWSFTEPPANIPANEACAALMDKLPISVGMTPMDALLAFVHAHKDFDKDPLKDLERRIDTIQKLLRARDDGVESQREAADLLMAWNYQHAEGGKHYHLDDGEGTAGSKPTEPSPAQKSALRKLNDTQLLLDSAMRTLTHLRWELFSLWWKYLSDPIGISGADAVLVQVEILEPRIRDLEVKVKELTSATQTQMDSLKAAKPGVMGTFARQHDPTLFVGAVKSGWPTDYLKALHIRTNSHVIRSAGFTAPSEWKFLADIIDKIMPDVNSRSAAHALLSEFLLLDPKNTSSESLSGTPPLYHDQLGEKSAWRDRWNSTQPFFPLFLEWEARYTHIPYKHWTMEERAVAPNIPKKIRYGIQPGVNLSELDLPHRLVSGRVLMLPQPVLSLKAKIDQLFNQTPKDVLDQHLTKDERDDLQKNLESLAFVSAPLTGFIDHLITRSNGNHIKPTTRPPGEANTPIEEASRVTEKAGFKPGVLRLVGDETHRTPYGTLVHPSDNDMLFKPVTHGQFRFTKINIVDKFGQVIHAIDPILRKDPPKPAYPCLSEFYQPQVLKENDKHKTSNTVVSEPEDLCSHIQLTPQINQLSRVNASFVQFDVAGAAQKAPWRPVDEWENPVWGWVLVNYANLGLQFFLYDGTFYREVRFGGPKGTQTSTPWLPFAPPASNPARNADTDPMSASKLKQLDLLIKKMGNPEYLQQFVDMITDAMRNSPAAPTAYGEFLNAVIGRPLALVNAAFSLELAVDAFRSQSTLEAKPKNPPEVLLKRDAAAKQPVLPGTKPLPKPPGAEQYSFPVKIGDHERLFDGLVAYFEQEDTPSEENQFKLDNFYTYFTAEREKPDPGSDPGQSKQDVSIAPEPKPTHRKPIASEPYPRLTAFWETPDSVQATQQSRKSPTWDEAYVQTHAYRRNSHLQAYATLINPFLALHLYSSLLPITSLTLPPWTWQQAMHKMTAFFHIGPVLVTENVPEYMADKRLRSENYNLAKTQLVSTAPVGIPTLQSGDWAWLQPYMDEQASKPLPGKPGDEPDPETPDGRVFMPLAMRPVDERPRFEKGPYTALEGYLQLTRPIVRPDVPFDEGKEKPNLNPNPLPS